MTTADNNTQQPSRHNVQIVRPRLAFEPEFGQYRTWWATSGALTGDDLFVLLHLLSCDANQPLNSPAELGLSDTEWKAAIENLMRQGFLLEIRDVDFTGQPRTRIVLQDPTQGAVIDLSDAIIVSSVPVELEFDPPLNGGEWA